MNAFNLFMSNKGCKQLQKFYLVYYVLDSNNLIFEVFDNCKNLLKIIKYEASIDDNKIILEDFDFNKIIFEATNKIYYFECVAYDEGLTMLNWTIDPAEYSC